MIIYEPRGAAAEYSPLAANLYRGCSHGCRYCYAPSCLRMHRSDFDRAVPRKNVLEELAKDAVSFAGDPRPVLLSFTSDPYQPIEEHKHLTRGAIALLARHNIKIRLLTKGAVLAMRDIDLFVRCGVEVGVTLCWGDDAKRLAWEPASSSISARIALLKEAKLRGLKTWVSVEPVIEPAEGIAAIRLAGPWADTIKIGKLNHHKDIEADVDWRAFRDEAQLLAESFGGSVYIKDDLRKAAGCSA